jgi:hypothetical protein
MVDGERFAATASTAAAAATGDMYFYTVFRLPVPVDVQR